MVVSRYHEKEALVPREGARGKAALEIDGAMGEGGGQILRTALSLSLCLQQPFRILNIRLQRSKPGLQRQHLAAVRAAAAIGRAEVDGAELGSTELRFSPAGITGGDYLFDIGSAGSTTLVLQTLLLPLLMAESPSRLQLLGGTHNPMAPSFEFVQQAFLPLLARMGAKVEMSLLRPGYYPVGGGDVRVSIHTCPGLQPLLLEQRGAIHRIRAVATLSRLPEHIAQRELRVVADGLGLEPGALSVQQEQRARCPGNALQVTVQSEACTEVFCGIGQLGLPAEVVAERVVAQVRRYLAAGVPVGPHLADQLLLPLALAGGGAFVTVAPDRHTPTNIDVIRHFLPLSIRTTEMAPDRWRIEIAKSYGGQDDTYP
jgi:RNA 3'-terminal phosphate cyclase (ATP)